MSLPATILTMNPYKLERQKLGLTQLSLSIKANITQQVVTNLESGLYYKPPVSITTILPNLEPAYYAWITLTRRANAPHFKPSPSAPSPYVNWPAFKLSVHKADRGFCRLLCYQPSLLREFDRYHRNVDTLATALSDVGLSPSTVKELLK